MSDSPPLPPVSLDAAPVEFARLRAAGQVSEALALAVQLLADHPHSAPVWLEYGRLLYLVQLYDHAETCFQRARELSPSDLITPLLQANNLVDRHNIRNRTQRDYVLNLDLWGGQYDSNLIIELFNASQDLSDKKLFGPALDCLNVLRIIAPNFSLTYYNMGTILWALCRPDEGTACFRQWAIVQMGEGNAKLWMGQPLDGKVVYVIADHGLGDIMQFIRVLPFMAQRCARLILNLNPNMQRLIGRMPGVEFANEVGMVEFDYMSTVYIAHYFSGVAVDDMGKMVPYIHAEPDRRSRWAAKIPATGLRIGIEWRSGGAGGQRSVDLREFIPLARLPGVHLVSLQKFEGVDEDHSHDDEFAALPPDIHITTFGSELDPGPDKFVDTAALIAELDLIISVDTSIAHLAGAMGKPTFVLLQNVCDWRWMDERQDCPWYPSARLFRQTRQGDWNDVMHRVIDAIAAMIPSFKSGNSPMDPHIHAYFTHLMEYSRNLMDRFPISNAIEPIAETFARLTPAFENNKAEEVIRMQQVARPANTAAPSDLPAGMNTIGILADRLTILVCKEWYLRNRMKKAAAADDLYQTQIKDIVTSLALATPGHAKLLEKVSSHLTDAKAVNFEEAYYGLLMANILMWENQEMLYVHDMESVPAEELRQYIRFFSDANMLRNACIAACETLYWQAP